MDHSEICPCERCVRVCAEVDARMTPEYVEARLRRLLFMVEVYAHLAEARRSWPPSGR